MSLVLVVLNTKTETMPKNNNTVFVVRTSSAKMPTTCWGTYRHVAVLEVEKNCPFPKMISERAKGVVRIVERWDKCFVGKTEKSAYYRCLKEAEDLASLYNNNRDILEEENKWEEFFQEQGVTSG